jgi:hypothetical protein
VLINLIHLFQERKILSLEDITIHFHIDKETALGLIETLYQKGKIEKLEETCKSCSSSCKSCSIFAKTMFFAWKK